MVGNGTRDEHTQERTQRTAAREAQREAQARRADRAREQLQADIKTAHAAAHAARTGLVRADALYRQLADHLREGILSGEYPSGTLLPSESALMAAHSLSRPTVRQAFDVLAAQGLIDTYNGRGRMVRPPHNGATRTLTRTSAAAHTLTLAGKPRHYRAPAGPQLAALLDMPADEPTFVEERTETGSTDDSNGGPMDVVLYRRVLPFSIAEGTSLQKEPYSERVALVEILREAYGPITWTEHVQARMPQPDETTALHLPEGTPILETIRTATAGDRPLFAESERRSAYAIRLTYRLTDPETTS